MGFRSQRDILDAINLKYPDAKGLSIKAFSWIAPVSGHVELAAPPSQDVAAELRSLATNLKTEDLLFRDSLNNVDFIGPSIDAGFRLSRFARPLQLVVSPALAYYFLKGLKRTNDFRIVGFESLKALPRVNYIRRSGTTRIGTAREMILAMPSVSRTPLSKESARASTSQSRSSTT